MYKCLNILKKQIKFIVKNEEQMLCFVKQMHKLFSLWKYKKLWTSDNLLSTGTWDLSNG